MPSVAASSRRRSEGGGVLALTRLSVAFARWSQVPDTIARRAGDPPAPIPMPRRSS